MIVTRATCILVFAAGLGMSVAGSPLMAGVDGASDNGFQVTETAHISASPDKVYGVLTAPARWWASDHTFSHDARNLSLDPHAGGCWCETVPGGGSVQHMTVVYAMPGKVLRLRGALGPMQGLGADGALTFSLAPASDGTDVVMTYALGGYAKGGFQSLAPVVDGVLGQQLAHLKQTVENDQ